MGLTSPRITGRRTGRGACLPTCPERPYAPWAAGGRSPLYVLDDLRTGCGDRVETCPADAIEEI
jgi:electron transport complex protein RnfB